MSLIVKINYRGTLMYIYTQTYLSVRHVYLVLRERSLIQKEKKQYYFAVTFNNSRRF